jgi:FkbM family methyltransferase
VRVYPYALCDFTGHTFMRAEPGNIGHAYIGEAEGLPVKVRTLDSFRFSEVRLIKIDVEGWEPTVLRGAWQTLNAWHPLVVMEDWTGGTYAGGLPQGYRLVADWEREHQMWLYGWE